MDKVLEKIDTPQFIKKIYIFFFALELFLMLVVVTTNDSPNSVSICTAQIITSFIGLLYILGVTFKISLRGRQKIIVIVLFAAAVLGRIISIIIMKNISDVQEQNCYIEESVKGCFMRMNIISIAALSVSLWRYIRYGSKEMGKKLSDF